jgi:hypothetical protein
MPQCAKKSPEEAGLFVCMVRPAVCHCWKMPWVIEFDIKGLFDHINKRAGRNLRKAWRYMAVTAGYKRELFYHWTLGKVPTI